jgi:DNA-binding IclR family transcriptional regulator
MEQERKESKRYVDAVLKALDILDCFQVRPSLQLKQISEMTKLNKSRILRLCGTVESMGYLVHDRETGLYSLGPKLLSLGKIYERNNTMISLARPILRDLTRITGESASLFVVDGNKRLCLAREEGTHSVRYSVSEGQRMELYAGSGGKVLLAFGPVELRRQFLRKGMLKRLTPHTIVDLGKLQEELELINRQGYGFSAGERDSDAASLAAPVYNHEKKMCAALAIAGPINRFLPEHNAEHLKMLLAAAQQLSWRLGYDSDGKR